MKKTTYLFMVVLALYILLAGCRQQAEPQPVTADQSVESSETEITGQWEGRLALQGTAYPVRMSFESTEDGLTGTLDIPDQGIVGMNLSNIQIGASGVHFEMDGSTGLARFDGQLTADGALVGEFQQGWIKGSFEMKRASAAADPEQAGSSSSGIEEPVPYLAEEVTFQNGDITLVGELTLPPTGGPHSAVILVSGSGAQDRNGSSSSVPGYEPSRMIADHLARNGIAALRYDERGAGESTGDQNTATITDLSTDIEAAMAYLLTRDEINPEQVGLLGHSEGSMLVAMVAARNPEVAFVISIGGHAVLGYDLMMAQTRKGLEVMGASEEETEALVQMAQAEYDQVLAQDWDAIEQQMSEMLPGQLEALPEEQRAALGEPEEIIINELNKMKTWAYSFLTHNPAEDWAQVNVPVLALFGELDVLVDLEQNKPPMEAALARAGNEDVTVVVFPEANHLFQQAEVGGPQEWNRLSKEFLPGLLETITDWLVERVDIRG